MGKATRVGGGEGRPRKVQGDGTLGGSLASVAPEVDAVVMKPVAAAAGETVQRKRKPLSDAQASQSVGRPAATEKKPVDAVRAPRKPRDPRSPDVVQRKIEKGSRFENKTLSAHPERPGVYVAHDSRGAERLTIEVYGSYIPREHVGTGEYTVILDEAPRAAKGVNQFVAMAHIEGTNPLDVEAIRTVEAKPARCCLGEGLNFSVDTIALEEREAGVYTTEQHFGDFRTFTLRTLLGWSPELNPRNIIKNDVEAVIVRGGVGTTQYEAIPQVESRTIQEYVRLLNCITRYEGVIKACMDSACKTKSGELPWSDPRIVRANQKRSEIVEALILALDSIETGIAQIAIGSDVSAELKRAVDTLETGCLSIAPIFAEDYLPKESILPVQVLRTDLSKRLEDLATRVSEVTGKTCDVTASAEVLNAAMAALPDQFIANTFRGGETLAKVQSELWSHGVRADIASSDLEIIGRLDNSDGAPKRVALARGVEPRMRLIDVRVVNESGAEYVVATTVEDREKRMQEYRTLRATGQLSMVAPDLFAPTIKIGVDNFVWFVQDGSIQMVDKKNPSPYERVLMQIQSATVRDCALYIGGAPGSLIAAKSWGEVRMGNVAERETVVRLLSERLTQGINHALAGQVAIERVELAAQDFDPTTVELFLCVAGKKFGPLSISGVDARDSVTLRPVIAEMKAAVAEAKKVEDEQKTQALYGFVDSAPLHRVIEYFQGSSVLTDRKIPEQLRTYAGLLKDAAARAVVADRMIARLRREIHLPDVATLTIVGRDPFMVEVGFEGALERVQITGVAQERVFAQLVQRLEETIAQTERARSSAGLLEKINTERGINPPIEIGEKFLIGLYEHTLDSLAVVSRGTEEVQFIFVDTDGVMSVVYDWNIVSQLERGTIRRLRFAAEDRYIADVSRYTLEYVTPADALAISGISRTELGGETTYRMRLSVQRGKYPAGTQMRLLGVESRKLAFGVEDQFGALSKGQGLYFTPKDILQHPTDFELPQETAYVALARALGCKTPEIAQELCAKMGGLAITEMVDKKETNGEKVRIVKVPKVTDIEVVPLFGGTNVRIKKLSGGMKIDMTLKECIAAIAAGTISVAEGHRAKFESTQAEVEPVIDGVASFGTDATYRFERALSATVREALRAGRVRVHQGDQTSYVQVVREVPQGMVVKYVRPNSGGERTFTYETIVAAFKSNTFIVPGEVRPDTEQATNPRTPPRETPPRPRGPGATEGGRRTPPDPAASSAYRAEDLRRAAAEGETTERVSDTPPRPQYIRFDNNPMQFRADMFRDERLEELLNIVAQHHDLLNEIEAYNDALAKKKQNLFGWLRTAFQKELQPYRVTDQTVFTDKVETVSLLQSMVEANKAMISQLHKAKGHTYTLRQYLGPNPEDL